MCVRSVCRLIFMIHQSRWSVDCTRGRRQGSGGCQKVRCASPGLFFVIATALYVSPACSVYTNHRQSHRNPSTVCNTRHTHVAKQKKMRRAAQMKLLRGEVTWSGRRSSSHLLDSQSPQPWKLSFCSLSPPPSPFLSKKALIYGNSFNVTFVLFHYLKPIGYWTKNP